MRFQVFGLMLFLMLWCCNPGDNVPSYVPGKTGELSYATGFSYERNDGDIIITVKDPWQKAKNTQFRYILTNDSVTPGKYKNDDIVINIPVTQVVCLSTTHIGFIDRLGMTGTISGISGKDLVVNGALRSLIDSSRVFDVGYDENINYELLLDLDPDVVFAYGVTSSVTRMMAKLKELDIPVVLVAEFLEEDPLAKMEWIRFFGCFYDMLPEASGIFDSAALEYNRLKETAARAERKPAVILGLPWRGTWYISGGSSYISRLISDAGGDYLWSSLDYKDSRPVGLEKVYEKALQADYWLNTGDAASKKDIISVDERFGKLKVFDTGNIYNNNRMLSPSGGNAYFESGVVEPQIILADLISILHPQLLPSHKLKYYQQLQ